MNYTEEYKGYKIEIIQDEGHDSPDDWGNTDIFLVYTHRDFEVNRKGFNPIDIYNHLVNSKDDDDFTEYDHPEFNNYFIFQVNAYIHSGIRLSLGDEYPFNDRWDVSTTGFILVEKTQSTNSVSGLYDGNLCKEIDTTPEQAKKQAESLIEEWNDYLSGNVWGYRILESKKFYKINKENVDNSDLFIKDIAQHFEIIEDWNEIDSCWGFYGDYEKNALLEARSFIDNIQENENTKE